MYLKRHLEAQIRKAAQHFKVLMLVGARQVGKSTLLAHLFPDCPHITFDASRDLYGVQDDPDLFLQNYPHPTIFDEIQYAPQLLSSIKRKVDAQTENGQYFLTGSQNLSVMRNAAESLAGRVLILNLRGLTPYEMAEQTDNHWLTTFLNAPESLPQTVNGLLDTGKTLYQHLWYGNLPAAQNLHPTLLPLYLDSYVITYLERDVRLLENVSDLSHFDRFLGVLAALSAQEINYSQLGREISVSPATSQKWLNVLKHSYLWHELPAFTRNMIKRISKKTKGYFADTGLLCHLQNIPSPESLGRHPLLGAIFETFCANLIMSLGQTLALPPKLYHWRSNGGAEVDLIMEYDQTFYPIEIKCKTTVNKRDSSGIKAFKTSYPELNIGCGLILYAGETCRAVEKDIIALPWNAVVA